jgi:4-amino-4-deoxy-L-arabinose transferase-like glycosyltransferase
MAALLLGVIILVYGLRLGERLADNLPLVLPLAVTMLSIFTRASDLRDYEFVMPLLILGLIVAVGCVVLTHYKFGSDRVRRRSLLCALLVTLIVYFSPFALREPVPPPLPEPATAEIGAYTVAIAYQDPGIIDFAPTYLKSRYLLRVERQVAATGIEDAKAIALQRFLADSESNLVKGKLGEKVAIPQDRILVLRE